MGVLTMLKEGSSARPPSIQSGLMLGPQFPKLHMYAPYLHDGATWGGYQPMVTTSDSMQQLCAAVLPLVLVSVLMWFA